MSIGAQFVAPPWEAGPFPRCNEYQDSNRSSFKFISIILLRLVLYDILTSISAAPSFVDGINMPLL